jgi:hypothetical protein
MKYKVKWNPRGMTGFKGILKIQQLKYFICMYENKTMKPIKIHFKRGNGTYKE